MDYTEYQTPEKLAGLQETNPELYWMLRALHLDDLVLVGDVFGEVYYRAQLVDGDLFFIHGDIRRMASDLVGASSFKIERLTLDPMDGSMNWRRAYTWQEGENPIACYRKSLRPRHSYHKVTPAEQFMQYNLPKAGWFALVGGLTGLGVGIVWPTFGEEPATTIAGAAIGLVVDVAWDLGEMATGGGPAGIMAGDEIYRYRYGDQGLEQWVIIRSGEVIQNTWSTWPDQWR